MKIIKIIALVASAAGMIVSVILTVQYYGTSLSAFQGICSLNSDGASLNSCAIVSTSDYSSISGIPMIGEIPISLAGFVFFGFLSFLIIISFFKKTNIDQSEIFSLALLLSSVALLINSSLYLISKFIIKFLCPLCVITYICTIIILPLIILLLPFRGKGIKQTVISILMFSFSGIRKNIITYASASFLLAACGFLPGIIFFSPPASAYSTMTNSEKITSIVRQYHRLDPVDFHVSSRAMTGKENAPVSVVIFHDFTCPFCINAGDLFKKMQNEYPDLIKIYYLPIPISGMCSDLSGGEDNPFADACIATLAAACAIDQHMFHQMYNGLYKAYSGGVKLTRQSVSRLAREYGFNIDRFNSCLSSKEAEFFIRANLTMADTAQVDAVPAIFIDGRRMPQIINEEPVLKGFLEYLKRKKF